VIYRGEGLPGRVWESGEPMWLEDVVRDRRFSLAEQAAAAGLHATFVFPIRSGEDTCGVMEFFSREIEHPDKSLLQMFSALGAQIGQFIERRRAEEQLRRTTADLQRSNTELQQFAYVASHDLSEPLRMVISYLQLLNEKQQGKLEPQTEEFLRFASEGAHRMQALIKDLLAYSRVDLRGRSFGETNVEQGLKAAMANLKVAIDESRAEISHDALPTLRADPVQITQVFQNLIGNAIKFRGTQPPRIHVSAELRQEEWLFGVRDNGIGIEPKNFDRIFVIFQRLHTRQEYPGTGMGLAICKRIIERHGGRIWLESQPGQGTVFYFTLPANKEAAVR
jgi:light-regulated signal transduction histidine kinase (bacteriophytochrome)